MLNFRKAEKSDVDLLFRWANDPVTRENSYYSKKITYAEHIKWFASELKKGQNVLLIFEDSEIETGLVRFSKDKDNWVIGISIDKDKRGLGLAVPMLKQSIEYFFKNIEIAPVTAFIKKTNLPSKHVFEKAGFQYEKDVVINGVESLKYKIYSHENRGF